MKWTDGETIKGNGRSKAFKEYVDTGSLSVFSYGLLPDVSLLDDLHANSKTGVLQHLHVSRGERQNKQVQSTLSTTIMTRSNFTSILEVGYLYYILIV